MNCHASFLGRVGVCLLLGIITQGHAAGQQSSASDRGGPQRFVRFQAGETVAYGIIEGDRIRQLEGDLFGKWSRTDRTVPLKDVELLVPSRPTNVIALARNYRDHLGDTQPSPVPEPFFKLPTSLQRPEGPIVLPKTTEDVHFEGELVIVIGKPAKNVSEAEAPQYILGVTCGNDVSARIWQKSDIQWWRAKGADTFGPCGPVIVSGLDYDNLDLETRVNGESVQKTNTKNMIHGVNRTVSFISQHVTLQPGDLIFTGTPGQTKALAAGDVVEVEIQGIGTLRNPVVAQE